MKTTRRNFIKTVAAPMIAVPFILPSRGWMFPPSSRITMGFVGMGKQSQWLLAKFLPLTQVLAVCDADTTRRVNSQQVVNKFYTDNKDKGIADCKAYTDYRELIERKDIDTVCIATPDRSAPWMPGSSSWQPQFWFISRSWSSGLTSSTPNHRYILCWCCLPSWVAGLLPELRASSWLRRWLGW